VFERKGRFLAVSAAVFSQIHSRSKSKARVVKAMRNIGKNCGGCHKPFRAPKKKKT
jgi:cytochrome c556